MEIRQFIRLKPVVFENDLLEHVRNLMAKERLYEVPVINQDRVLGIVSIFTLSKILDEFELGNVVARNFLEKNFLSLDLKLSVKDFAKSFVETKHHIACIFENKRFVGYVKRVDLLNFLLKKQRSIKGLVIRDFLEISFDDDFKKLLKAAFEGKACLVLKNKKPYSAFLSEEVIFTAFISDFLTRKYHRDFETLRAEKRMLLRHRLDQQLLSCLKDKPLSHYPLLSVAEIATKEFFIDAKAKASEVAKIMLENDKLALATEKGIIADFCLLRCI